MHPLIPALEAAVPLRILTLHAQGRPTDEDWVRAREFSVELATKGDVLLYGGGKRNEAADLFNKLVQTVAVIAFCPGGITVFGRHWEARGGGQTGEQHQQTPSATRPRFGVTPAGADESR